MNIWFMFDNHTFRSIPSLSSHPRTEVYEAIRSAFLDDRYGCVFARGAADKEIAGCHTLLEVDKFLDKCEEYMNWEARG